MARIPLAFAVAALSLLAAPTAGNPYCTNGNYFWLPDGTSIPGSPDWSSTAKNSRFVMGPCLGLSGIGTTETFAKTVLVIDRAAAQNGYMKLPGRPKDLAYAQEVNLVTMKQRPLDVITNTFCSTGQHWVDGTFISIGGDWSPDYAGPGEFSIRTLSPCTNGTCGFTVSSQLARSRWYPTSALLGDGRVLIVGGSTTGVALTSAATNVPFIEYFPRAAGVDAVNVDFLSETMPYNLFPFVHVLPSGKVFVFASHKWMLWDTAKDQVGPGNYPNIVAKDAAGSPLRFTYPTAGTSTLFPLTSANKYTAEVMICGGSATKAIYWAVVGKTAAGDENYPATNKCFRIQPEAPAPEWVEEEMQVPRVMPVGVLLPDGTFAILSGTQTGYSGLGQLAHKPALRPEIFNTNTLTWFKEPLATSKVPRAYHSSAFLAHDGSVFLSGSNPNSNIVTNGDDFPTEFRTEFFHPPYMMPGVPRPTLISAPSQVAYGSKILVAFKYGTPIRKVQVVLAQPGFSTHSGNHGMRNVVLDIAAVRSAGAVHVATVAVPLNRNVLPPTWYWLFVVVNGSPNGEGHHCFLKAPVPAIPAMPKK